MIKYQCFVYEIESILRYDLKYCYIKYMYV